MSADGVRRAKNGAFLCKSRPATAPAGSNRSNYGENEMVEAFGYLPVVSSIIENRTERLYGVARCESPASASGRTE